MSDSIWAELYVPAASLSRESVVRLIDRLVALRLTNTDYLDHHTYYSLHTNGDYESYENRPIAEFLDALDSMRGCSMSLVLGHPAMNREADDFWVDLMLDRSGDDLALGFGSVSVAMSQVQSRKHPSWFPEFLALTRLLAEQLDATYGWAATEIENEIVPVSIASVEALEPQPPAWVNIYGPSYVENIGYERLMSAPAWRVEALANGGVMVTQSPTYWEYLHSASERALAEYLGLPHRR